MSLLLGIAELLGRRKRNFAQLGLTDSTIMGFAQSLAIIPGVSRSGATLTAGLFMGLSRETAARFSFLLGIPAVLSACLVELKDAFKVELGSTVILPLIVGLISTTIFSNSSDRVATSLPKNPKHLDICLLPFGVWISNFGCDRGADF